MDPVVFRKADYLKELADEFNEMMRALEQRVAVTVKQPAAAGEKRQPLPV